MYPQNTPPQTAFAMNTDPDAALVPAASPEEASQPLVQQEVSEATCGAFLSARAPETRRLQALPVRAFGARLEEDALRVPPIDAANYWRALAPSEVTAGACRHRLP